MLLELGCLCSDVLGVSKPTESTWYAFPDWSWGTFSIEIGRLYVGLQCKLCTINKMPFLFIAIPQILEGDFILLCHWENIRGHVGEAPRGQRGHGSEEVQTGLGSSRYQREGILSVQATEDGQDGKQNSSDTRNQHQGALSYLSYQKGSAPKI